MAEAVEEADGDGDEEDQSENKSNDENAWIECVGGVFVVVLLGDHYFGW